MANNFSLTRTKQCSKCPWKVKTDPSTIPDGYSVELHKSLACTIAKEGDFSPTKAMACHHSKPGAEEYCIGWLHNQLGPGNNIALRMKMMKCSNLADMKIYGKQHRRFKDTIK